jgi:cell division protein FtsZ
MIAAGMRGVEFIAVDTDAATLSPSRAARKIHLGDKRNSIRIGDELIEITAGGDPTIGHRLAVAADDALRDAMRGAELIFIVAGMGGDTGSSAAPVIAQIATELGILTVGVITIPNNQLLFLGDAKLTMPMAFALADEVIGTAVQSVSGTITAPGLLHVAFAEVKRLLATGGSAAIGVGRASGTDRAASAARGALRSPLIDTALRSADSLLFTLAGSDFTLFEIAEAAATIMAEANGRNAACIGTVTDHNLGQDLQVMVLATGTHDMPNKGSETRQHPTDPPSGGPPPSDQRIPRRPPLSPFAGSAEAIPPASSRDEIDAVATIGVPWLPPNTSRPGGVSPV